MVDWSMVEALTPFVLVYVSWMIWVSKAIVENRMKLDALLQSNGYSHFRGKALKTRAFDPTEREP